MPVYLGPIRRERDPLDGSPVIMSPVTGPGTGWIHLGPAGTDQGSALVYSPDPIADARFDKIGETNRRETLGLQTRTVIGNRLSLTLREVDLDKILAEILMDHGDGEGRTKWGGIRGFPSKRRSRYEIYLGALGLVWALPVARGPSTQVFTETWPTNGAVTSGQDQSWSVLSGGVEVSAGRFRADSTALQVNDAICNSTLDTANQRHTANFIAVDAGANITQWRLYVRCQDSDNTYFCNFRRDNTKRREGQKRVGGSSTTIISDDSTDPGASGTCLVEIDGSTMTISPHSTGTGTDGSPQLTTLRNGGCMALTSGAVGDLTLDSHTIEDIVTAFDLDAQPGSYSLSGAVSGVLAARLISSVPGSYSLTGAAAGVPAGRVINAASGTYIATGSQAQTAADRLFDAQPGSYAVTGILAELLKGYTINAEPGTYAAVGSVAGLLGDRVLNAAPGSYVFTGVEAELLLGALGFSLNAEPGVYAVTGATASLLAGWLLSAAPGTYVLTGTLAELLYEVAAGGSDIKRQSAGAQGFTPLVIPLPGTTGSAARSSVAGFYVFDDSSPPLDPTAFLAISVRVRLRASQPLTVEVELIGTPAGQVFQPTAFQLVSFQHEAYLVRRRLPLLMN